MMRFKPFVELELPAIHDSKEDSLWRKTLKKGSRFALRSLMNLQLKASPTFPWMVFSAVDFMEKTLPADAVAFEWGSGRSTLYFAERLKKLVSIEHDESWYHSVKTQLSKLDSDHVDYRYIPKSTDSFVEKAQRPEVWRKLNYRPRKPSFQDYFDAILEFDDAFFDMVIVDGRARVACVLNAMDKLKPGGVLVLDNSDREEYRKVFHLFESWDLHEFKNGIQETAVMVKPQEQ